jgi:pilus assembly protein Flp/PilA
MRQATLKFFKDDSGASAIEYALLAGLIAVAIVTTVTILGGAVRGLFETVVARYP